MVTVRLPWRTAPLLPLVLVGAFAAAAPRAEPRAVAAQSSSIAPIATVSDRIDREALMAIVRTLASPPFQGRRTGTDGSRAARAFIRNAFTEIGLEPAGRIEYDQPFRFTRTSIRGLLLPGREWKTEYPDAANLIGRVAGTRPEMPAIVVTAHYDHLGTESGRVYAGADDNASGVAALLALARHVKAHPLMHTALFVALDSEEIDLQGARAFMRSPPVPPSAMALNLNLDMVSRSDRNEIFAAGTYQSPWLKPVLEDVQRRTTVRIRFGHDAPAGGADTLEDWTLQSDHGIFHQAGVPFLYFGVEDHPDYHKPTDTADKIDPVFFRNVVEMVVETVLAVDSKQ